jgi:hypothetical protein
VIRLLESERNPHSNTSEPFLLGLEAWLKIEHLTNAKSRVQTPVLLKEKIIFLLVRWNLKASIFSLTAKCILTGNFSAV